MLSQAPTFLFTMAVFIAVLTVIVFIHEMGHFLVGRWCGARVDAFSIGFGREIFGWYDKHGTRWKISWLPLGGYVKFAGDANAASMGTQEASQDPTTFHGRPLWQRALIVVAGPVANFLLAIVLFTGLYSIVGVPDIPAVVSGIVPQSAAQDAGLKKGDRIIQIDGNKITSFSDISRNVADKKDVEISVVVVRDGQEITFKATPKGKVRKDGMGGKVEIGLLGVQRPIGVLKYNRKNPAQAFSMAVGETWFVITKSLSYMKSMIVGRVGTEQLAGPLGIAKMTGKVAHFGFWPLVHLGAILSISIGLINLFPVPMLDGGHLMYYAIEAVRGKALSQRAQELGFMVGFALVISLMIFATKNDILLRTGWFSN
jgi:regulator of sigma E protease